jgi:hypothetical protein
MGSSKGRRPVGEDRAHVGLCARVVMYLHLLDEVPDAFEYELRPEDLFDQDSWSKRGDKRAPHLGLHRSPGRRRGCSCISRAGW